MEQQLKLFQVHWKCVTFVVTLKADVCHNFVYKTSLNINNFKTSCYVSAQSHKASVCIISDHLSFNWIITARLFRFISNTQKDHHDAQWIRKIIFKWKFINFMICENEMCIAQNRKVFSRLNNWAIKQIYTSLISLWVHSIAYNHRFMFSKGIC